MNSQENKVNVIVVIESVLNSTDRLYQNIECCDVQLSSSDLTKLNTLNEIDYCCEYCKQTAVLSDD